MLLYLMRHGDAGSGASSDPELTERGRSTTLSMARVLSRLQWTPPEIVIASPLQRAQQTASIVHETVAPNATLETNPTLLPQDRLEGPMSLLIHRAEKYKSIMFVSHDPLLTIMTSAIITGGEGIVLEMHKSSVAIFEMTRMEYPRMRGALRAFLPPEIVG